MLNIQLLRPVKNSCIEHYSLNRLFHYHTDWIEPFYYIFNAVINANEVCEGSLKKNERLVIERLILHNVDKAEGQVIIWIPGYGEMKYNVEEFYTCNMPHQNYIVSLEMPVDIFMDRLVLYKIISQFELSLYGSIAITPLRGDNG